MDDSQYKNYLRLEKAKFKARIDLQKELQKMTKGDPGYTPIKGKDYFTPSEIDEIKKTILGLIPKPKNGKDAVVDYEKILQYTYAKVAEHVAKIPTPKKGDKGDKGDTPVIDIERLVQQVITALPKQKDKKLVIDRQQILDLIEERVSKIQPQTVRVGASVASIRALTDVNLDGLEQDEQGNYILGSGSGGTARTFTSTTGATSPSADSDYYIFVTGAHTVTMPTAVDNTYLYTIKNKHTAPITVNTTSSETIDGTLTISVPYQHAVTLVSDNSNWNIV